MIGFILRYFRRRRARREYIRLTWAMTGCMMSSANCWRQAAANVGSPFGLEQIWIDEAMAMQRRHNELRDQRAALGVK